MTDTITLPREVVQFMLQHLEWWNDDEPQEKEAITALRKALAAEQPSEDIEALRRENERLKAVAFQAQDAAIYLAKQNERMAADSALLVFGAVNERAVQMTQRRDQGEACSYPRCPNDGGRCARLFAGQCSGPREADPQQVPR